HAVGAAHLTCLGGDAEPAGGADEREGGLRAGAADLEGRGTARFGERTVGEERSAPRRGGVGDAATDHLRRQSAHGSSAPVEQAGATGQCLTVLADADDVPGALAQTARAEHLDLGGIAVELEDLAAEATCDRSEVYLGLDDHPSGDDVQSPGEAQEGGHLGLAIADPGDRQPAQLVLDLRCHCHETLSLPSPRAARTPPREDRHVSSAPANLAGSCRCVPVSATSTNETSAPNRAADRLRCSRSRPSGTEAASTTTWSTRKSGACWARTCR